MYAKKYLQGRSGKGLVHEPKMAPQSSDDSGIAFSSDFVGDCNLVAPVLLWRGGWVGGGLGEAPPVLPEFGGKIPPVWSIDTCFFNIAHTTCMLKLSLPS